MKSKKVSLGSTLGSAVVGRSSVTQVNGKLFERNNAIELCHIHNVTYVMSLC